jgi:glucoamylase
MRLLRLVVLLVLLTPGTALATTAPGAPGQNEPWAPADKDGFGTSATTQSKVWHTLDNGELTEVYYPDLGTPAVHDLQFAVSDGRTFAERESDSTSHSIALTDSRSLSYRQVNTTKRYRITKTYVTDPARDALEIDVRFESLTGQKLDLYTLFDPALSNGAPPPTGTPDDDSGSTSGDALVTQDAKAGSALVASPSFERTSNGYLGTSDGWTDLRSDFRMDGAYASAPNGNVVQTGKTALDGVKRQRMTLVVGFGPRGADALSTARAALARGYDAAASSYAAGWHGYLGGLKAPPASVSTLRTDYDVSVMTLAAHEDKTYRGGYIASPSMPWVWGTTSIENPSGAYHLVWSRDLYQIATALLAAGDRAGAGRALSYVFERQQKANGCFPQNSNIDGTEHWTNLQLDEAAFPVVLAWQLGGTDDATYKAHVKPAIGCILANGPQTVQERWENQGGWSPATIAAEIAALVTGADIARRNHDPKTAKAWEAKADEWQGKVDSWTYTTTGDFGKGYYLRLTKDANPNAGTKYSVGDSGPEAVDQRDVVDPSYLELVRLGVKRANDPHILSTIPVVDQQLGASTPNGTFWHRYNFDGYGEQTDGSPWNFGFPANTTDDWANNATIGRVWPIFAGERGEYEVAAGKPSSARERLASIARAGGEGHMIPEQVWDESGGRFPPSGQPGFPSGEATLSASPLAWSHAVFVRLAWSIDAGRPIEQPSVVACRYSGCG